MFLNFVRYFKCDVKWESKNEILFTHAVWYEYLVFHQMLSLGKLQFLSHLLRKGEPFAWHLNKEEREEGKRSYSIPKLVGNYCLCVFPGCSGRIPWRKQVQGERVIWAHSSKCSSPWSGSQGRVLKHLVKLQVVKKPSRVNECLVVLRWLSSLYSVWDLWTKQSSWQ